MSIDTILNIPFLGEFITGTIVSYVAVRVRGLLHRSTLVVNTRGKKAFNMLPSWFKTLAYKTLLEAKVLFPISKQEEILEYVCNTLKMAIKGKLDDIVIDVVKKELLSYILEMEGKA